MNKEFEKISKKEGLQFIQELLDYEKRRIDEFLSALNKREKNIFEQINIDFGIFPEKMPYPVYFCGDITKPKNKIVFIGINPGYNEKTNNAEQDYLNNLGVFRGYCEMFSSFFRDKNVAYYKNMYSFLASVKKESGYFFRAVDKDTEDFSVAVRKNKNKLIWDWLQDNVINLEAIPYHSKNTNGLTINDIERYKERYLMPLLKIIKHIDPQTPIFILGYPTVKRHFENENLKDFFVKNSTLVYHNAKGKKKEIAVGKLGGYDFVGLPFLNNYIAKEYPLMVKAINKYFNK